MEYIEIEFCKLVAGVIEDKLEVLKIFVYEVQVVYLGL